MKRTLMFAATAAAVLASTGTAIAAGGQQLCLGAPMSAVTTPDSDGGCKRGTPVTVLTEQDLSALEGRLSALEADNSTLRTKVSTLEDKLSRISYDETGLNDKPTLTIAGANLQIVDGSGDTGGTTNGLGNLFIGYDEHTSRDEQTGSHNLVLGSSHEFTSFGGLITGDDHTVTGRYSFVSGSSNTASGGYSSVSGGSGNTASGLWGSVSGGGGNTASGSNSSVSGGGGNTASGLASSILGGRNITVDTIFGTSP